MWIFQDTFLYIRQILPLRVLPGVMLFNDIMRLRMMGICIWHFSIQSYLRQPMSMIIFVKPAFFGPSKLTACTSVQRLLADFKYSTWTYKFYDTCRISTNHIWEIIKIFALLHVSVLMYILDRGIFVCLLLPSIHWMCTCTYNDRYISFLKNNH